MMTGASPVQPTKNSFSVHSSKMNSQSFNMHLSSTGNFLSVYIIATISFHSLYSYTRKMSKTNFRYANINCLLFYPLIQFCQYNYEYSTNLFITKLKIKHFFKCYPNINLPVPIAMWPLNSSFLRVFLLLVSQHHPPAMKITA